MLCVFSGRADARWRSRLHFARGARSLGRLAGPRQLPFDFELQRHAEEGADQDNEYQHEHVLQRGRDDDGADDVARDEEFETEQDCVAKILPAKAVAFAGGLRSLDEKPAVAMRAPSTTTSTPALSMATPMISMTWRK